MNEMIERAANKLALDIAKFKTANQPGAIFTAQDIVRSVLEAIREPTDAMIKAGEVAQSKFDSRYEQHNADEVWQAMIDGMLK